MGLVINWHNIAITARNEWLISESILKAENENKHKENNWQ